MLTFKVIGIVSLFLATVAFVWMTCMRDDDATQDHKHHRD